MGKVVLFRVGFGADGEGVEDTGAEGVTNGF